jgi:hypothetical protein
LRGGGLTRSVDDSVAIKEDLAIGVQKFIYVPYTSRADPIETSPTRSFGG